ncbi:MAG: serine/threonine protein kinase [Proteobacteria bacterium]|nr:serine/threonine protein kinase [Pseudomonadota bacterium]
MPSNLTSEPLISCSDSNIPCSPLHCTMDNDEHHSHQVHDNTSIMANRYTYMHKLGKGSQGQVWLAKRNSDNELVAIKQLNIHSVTTWKMYELFKREANILENLNIQGVVPFYEYVEDLQAQPPFVCIVQKFIDGQTLAEMLKSKHRFETETIYDIITQILKILEKLHTHHPPVIHRDIKPSNLMLTPTNDHRYTVTLLDFGAVANPQVQNGGSTVAGTFGYMPPEQLMGQAQPASDIYALAAVAVELLSGTSPADIPACDFKLVIEPYLQHLPKEVVQTLNMMLEPALINRICDYPTLIAQFEALAHKKQPSFLSFLRQTSIPKLEDVECICQPGNYEIWQNLDQGADINLNKYPTFINISASNSMLMESSNTTSNSKPPILILGIIVIVFILSYILIQSKVGLIIIAVFLMVSFPITLIAAFKTSASHSPSHPLAIDNANRKNLISTDTYSNLLYDRKEALRNIENILSYGEKIVGTITAIYYVNACPKNIEYRPPHIINHITPMFWVIYRFRHPKFDNHELYGELNMPIAPEGRYKVGDPLTLVALLETSNHSSEYRLNVVPYPYPYGDFTTQEDIVFHDTCEIKSTPDTNMLGDSAPFNHHGSYKQSLLHSLSNLNNISVDNLSNNIKKCICNYCKRKQNTLNELLAERYILAFQSNKNEQMLLNAADIYRWKLSSFYEDKYRETFHQLANHYISKSKSTNHPALLLNALRIFQDILVDTQLETKIYSTFQSSFTEFIQSNPVDSVLREIDICMSANAHGILISDLYEELYKSQFDAPDIIRDTSNLTQIFEHSLKSQDCVPISKKCAKHLIKTHIKQYKATNHFDSLQSAFDIHEKAPFVLEQTRYVAKHISEYYVREYETTHDINVLQEAVEFFQHNPNTYDFSKDIAVKMLNHHTELFNYGNESAIWDAAYICQDILLDENKYTELLLIFANKYIPNPNDSNETFNDYIMQFMTNAKCDEPFVAYIQAFIMIWMNKYQQSIEKIWEKLTPFFTNEVFKQGMFTAYACACPESPIPYTLHHLYRAMYQTSGDFSYLLQVLDAINKHKTTLKYVDDPMFESSRTQALISLKTAYAELETHNAYINIWYKTGMIHQCIKSKDLKRWTELFPNTQNHRFARKA